MANIVQGKMARNGVAVIALFEFHIALVGLVGHTKCLGNALGLAMKSRPRHTVVDFLQQGDVWIVVCERLNNPLQTIPPVGAADAFVNVISDQSKAHSALLWTVSLLWTGLLSG